MDPGTRATAPCHTHPPAPPWVWGGARTRPPSPPNSPSRPRQRAPSANHISGQGHGPHPAAVRHETPQVQSRGPGTSPGDPQARRLRPRCPAQAVDTPPLRSPGTETPRVRAWPPRPPHTTAPGAVPRGTRPPWACIPRSPQRACAARLGGHCSGERDVDVEAEQDEHELLHGGGGEEDGREGADEGEGDGREGGGLGLVHH